MRVQGTASSSPSTAIKSYYVFVVWGIRVKVMINNFKLKYAVVPVAGLGTRFLPVTRTVPKVLLPIISTPVIEFAVREIAEIGIENIVFVIGPDMEIVKDYFKPNSKLMDYLKRSNQIELQKQQSEISNLANISVIYQSKPRGLGDAILLTQKFVGYNPFLVVLPDDLVFHEISASQQLVNSRKNNEGTFVALTRVQNSEIPKKGIISGHELQQNFYKITHMIEKPSIDKAPSNLSIVGRYILTNEIFDALRDTKPGKGDEIQLTDGINLLKTGTDVYGVVLDGHHIDVGNPSGMLEAMLRASKSDSEIRKKIKSIVSKW